MPDFDGIAAALAARFAAAQVTPPAGGYDNIRVATADLPNQMTPLPTVLVYLDSGDFTAFPGKRDGRSEWSVRFYYNQTGDLPRDMKALRLWAAVLIDQLKISTQLGGIVTLARVDSFRIGILNYAGIDYTGLELGVGIVTNEAWAAVA
jgi:hypothetical protein